MRVGAGEVAGYRARYKEYLDRVRDVVDAYVPSAAPHTEVERATRRALTVLGEALASERALDGPALAQERAAFQKVSGRGTWGWTRLAEAPQEAVSATEALLDAVWHLALSTHYPHLDQAVTHHIEASRTVMERERERSERRRLEDERNAEEEGRRHAGVLAGAHLGVIERLGLIAQAAWACPDGCGDTIWREPSGEPLFECASCGTQFVREASYNGTGNQCPDCRKFAGKVGDNTCPECGLIAQEEVEAFACPVCGDLYTTEVIGVHFVGHSDQERAAAGDRALGASVG